MLHHADSRALWRPSGQTPGQYGPSLHRVINETAFQKKKCITPMNRHHHHHRHWLHHSVHVDRCSHELDES
jgi:hypothetical protein